MTIDLTQSLVMSALHLPPLLVRHLTVPVQVPALEGRLVRISVSVVNVSIVLLTCHHQ